MVLELQCAVVCICLYGRHVLGAKHLKYPLKQTLLVRLSSFMCWLVKLVGRGKKKSQCSRSAQY